MLSYRMSLSGSVGAENGTHKIKVLPRMASAAFSCKLASQPADESHRPEEES